MMRLSDGEKSWRICFTRFETLYERDIQRDGGTPQDGIGRACSLAIGCSRATKKHGSQQRTDPPDLLYNTLQLHVIVSVRC